MAKGKLGRHKGDAAGRTNPTKSMEITTGTYKKPETYETQAAEHKDTGRVAQDATVHHTTEGDSRVSLTADSRVQEMLGAKRSGSHSDAHKGRKQATLHEANHRAGNTPGHAAEDVAACAHDLHAHRLAGENHGAGDPYLE